MSDFELQVERNHELRRIADSLQSFTDPQIDPNTGEALPSYAELVIGAIVNPPQIINVSNSQEARNDDDLDPTFAALAGACYSFADQLDTALNEPDQFKKAQALRGLVSRVRTLADKYAESAAAEDYQRMMQNRIRRVDSTHGEESQAGVGETIQDLDEEAAPQRGEESEGGSGKYRAQKVWEEAVSEHGRKGPKAQGPQS